MREVLAWIATSRSASRPPCSTPAPTAVPDRRSTRCGRCGRPTPLSLLAASDRRDGARPVAEPSIAAATIGDSQITPEGSLDGHNTLYLISPADDQRRLRGLFCALVADIVAGAFARSTPGKPIDPPLLLALDEARTSRHYRISMRSPRPVPARVCSCSRSFRTSARHPTVGDQAAPTILANHRARVFCSGIAGKTTLDYLRSTLGEQEIASARTNRQGLFCPRLPHLDEEFRAPATPDRVRQTAPDTALLIYGRLAPAGRACALGIATQPFAVSLKADPNVTSHTKKRKIPQRRIEKRTASPSPAVSPST